MQALFISIYTEYSEQQRNGSTRLSNPENSHIGDVFQVKTFATQRWWTHSGFYHEIVKTSGNRLKELFPTRIMTHFNLPCELQCIELIYVMESDPENIYIIPADYLASNDHDLRPQPIMDLKTDSNDQDYFHSEIKLKWKLIYDDPSNILVPQLSFENQFLREIKLISEDKKENQISKMARILMSYNNFTEELKEAKKNERAKFDKPLSYAEQEPSWENGNLLCLKFNNKLERSLVKPKKRTRRKRKINKSGELLIPLYPSPNSQNSENLTQEPNPFTTPPKRQNTLNDLPERPPNPLFKSYDENNSIVMSNDDDDDDTINQERPDDDDHEILNKEQIDMINLEEKAWMRVETLASKRRKQKSLKSTQRQKSPPQTVKRVIRNHNCPYEGPSTSRDDSI